MPYLMSTSLDRFLEKITIPGDHRTTATQRRDRISELLKDHFDILDIFPTGSAVRGTGLKGKSDVDVMVVLHYGKHVKDKTPKQLLQSVQDVLSEYDARIVKKNGQAVTLYFKTWPNVDIVPAKRMDSGELQIPDANTGRWISTDPAAHDRAMAALSNRGRQLVRMVKHWNDAHSGYLLSFHIEKIALQTSIVEAAWAEDDWPWTLKAFFEKAIELTEPTAVISDSYDVDDWSELRSRLVRAKELSFDAWQAVRDNDVEEAVDRCRVLFGSDFPSYG